ncbi:hypothetical protein [Limnobacter sp. CACIAM 66H1]|uniref:hypothetical protein n=1 Tax=Limnobacter sp. CACIAM 66H1 TaxID=1813033 RepID=UPI0025BFE75F|nr:hypothetical protein [Limnobacter sp. CACIAM 66H1]
MIRSTSTLKSLLVPSLRVFLIGLCTALTACVATPPSPSLAIALPEAQHTLELNAVFWADKVQHSNNAWQRHQQTFTFRLENIPASQVLELISRELQLGYPTTDQANQNRYQQFFINPDQPAANPVWLSFERLNWLWMKRGALDTPHIQEN